jgi:hypothetical protein
MKEPSPFSQSIYEQRAHLAERELCSFAAAVTALYGPEQARLSAEDWLEESELVDSPPGSEARNWRAVTIAASARLANRVNVSVPALRTGAGRGLQASGFQEGACKDPKDRVNLEEEHGHLGTHRSSHRIVHGGKGGSVRRVHDTSADV